MKERLIEWMNRSKSMNKFDKFMKSCRRIWQRPYRYIVLAIVVAFALELVFLVLGNMGIFDKMEEFSFSIFMEAFFILVTIILIEDKLKEKERNQEENHRRPIYKSAYHDAYRIWERIYYLGYKIMMEAFVYGQNRSGADDSEVMRSFMEPEYVDFVKNRNLEYLPVQDIIHSFFQDGRILFDFSEKRSGLYGFRWRTYLPNEIRKISREVENYLQRHGAFFVSKDTEELGSYIFATYSSLGTILREIEDFLDSQEYERISFTVKSNISMSPYKCLRIEGYRDREEAEDSEDIDLRFLDSKLLSGLCELYERFDALEDISNETHPISDSIGRSDDGDTIELFIYDERKRESRKIKNKLHDEGKMTGLEFKGKMIIFQFISMGKFIEEGKIRGHSVEQSGREINPDLYTESRRRLHHLFAENGLADAQFNLASMYENDLDGKQNNDEAFRWYRQAAKQVYAGAQFNLGHAGAQFNLGLMYEQGRGVEQDDAQAELWCRRAVEQRHADAQFNLGLMYEQGRGVARDDAEAVRWYRQAAERGHAGAQFNLGLMYAQGRGVAQDDAQAVLWYHRAAEQGEAEALTRLRQAAEQNHAGAQFSLGLMYEQGRGVAQDDAEAVRWYRQAAEQRHAEAQFNLGLMYEQGRGVEQDDAQAELWYRRATKKGHAGAQFNLGLMYEQGRGVAQDDAQAVLWCRRAAEHGLDFAQHNLGVMYAQGRGVAQDDAGALTWFRQAAEQGHAEAQQKCIELQLTRAPLQEDTNQVEQYLQAAKQGQAFYQLMLGLMYAQGRGVAQDNAEAVTWFRRAAERGLVLAQSFLGLMYGSGLGVEQDDTEAVTWFRRAAKQGWAFAQNSLGLIYCSDLGVEQDDAEAVTWFRRAAKQGSAFAQNNLGVMYLDGRGVEQSVKEARKLFHQACEQGNVGAKFNLGIIAWYDSTQSFIEGMKQMRQAKKEGYPLGATPNVFSQYVKSQWELNLQKNMVSRLIRKLNSVMAGVRKWWSRMSASGSATRASAAQGKTASR